jgi:adenylate kinase
MQPQTIILFGRSGSGKGTQAKLLEEYIEKNDNRKVLYFQTGEGLRALSKRDTHTGSLINKTLSEGLLVPEFLPIWTWTDFFIQNFTGDEHIILDGVGRRANEVPVLDSALQFFGRNATLLVVDISEECARDRLISRGRSDDTDESISKRLSWYATNVVPAIDMFKDKHGHKIMVIDGERSIEEIHKDILSKLGFTK